MRIYHVFSGALYYPTGGAGEVMLSTENLDEAKGFADGEGRYEWSEIYYFDEVKWKWVEVKV